MSSNDKFLSSCVIYIIDLNIIRARMNIFETQIRRFGGRLIETPTAEDEITHIIVDDELSEETAGKIIWKQFAELFEKKKKNVPKILKSKWLSGCIKQKKLIDTTPFEMKLPPKDAVEKKDRSPRESVQKRDSSTDKSRKRNSSSEMSSGGDSITRKLKTRYPSSDKLRGHHKGIYDQTTDEDSSGEEDRNLKEMIGRDGSISPPEKQARIEIEQTSGETINLNKNITDQLQILADAYRSTNDKWRALSYDKAIESLKRHPKPVSSYQEIRNMRGIGQRLADKIWEIHESGTLRKAEEFLNDEKIRAVSIFSNVFGAGPSIAHQWYNQGCRTLQDVLEKGNPTAAQRIGIKYYDEFQLKMDRAEATEIIDTVGKAMKEISPDVIYDACGSYRRGRPKCGDVDILFTHPDGRSHAEILNPLVKKLTESAFLTDHLIEFNESWNGGIYMGVCKLKGDDKKHRRLDIVPVIYEEYPTALIAWTGSSYFLRQLYSKAKSMGMRLNRHGLRGGIMRQGGEKVTEGYLIPTPTEESVFEKLGLPYRKPEERDTIFTDL